MTTGNQLIRITKTSLCVTGDGGPRLWKPIPADNRRSYLRRVTVAARSSYVLPTGTPRCRLEASTMEKIVGVTTSDRGDGMLLDEYRVGIYSFVRKPVGMEMVPSAIDKKYNSPSTSGLTIEVTSSGENHFNFDLDPPSK